MNVRGEPFRFGGLEPTGPLPAQMNFPLIKSDKKYSEDEDSDKKCFRVTISAIRSRTAI